jgi:two-component system, LytTR family, response regulator
MKALIIDDEQSARDTLKILLKSFCPTVEIIAEADSGDTGIEAIHHHKPELVFLDVEIGDMTSFEMLDKMGFPSVEFEIIFSTAHGHYAVDAFRYSAVDFLPKPIRERDLQKSVMRAQERLRDRQSLLFYAILKENLKPQSQKKMLLKTMEGTFIVTTDEIIAMQTIQSKTMTDIFLTNKREQIIAKTIGEYENLAPFIRVHNNAIINPNHIARLIKTNNNWQLEMTDGHIIDVARGKREKLIEWMDKFENLS